MVQHIYIPAPVESVENCSHSIGLVRYFKSGQKAQINNNINIRLILRLIFNIFIGKKIKSYEKKPPSPPPQKRRKVFILPLNQAGYGPLAKSRSLQISDPNRELSSRRSISVRLLGAKYDLNIKYHILKYFSILNTYLDEERDTVHFYNYLML